MLNATEIAEAGKTTAEADYQDIFDLRDILIAHDRLVGLLCLSRMMHRINRLERELADLRKGKVG